MNDEAKPTSALSTWVVRAAGLWVLAGALFKLFLGTPADLPEVLRHLPIGLGLTYKLAIGVELVVAALALLRPRWGSTVVAATFLVFGGVLASQIAAGAATCGCFGSTIPMPPWGMLAIDGTLLVAMLLTRPWAGASVGLQPIVLGVVLIVAAALPWFFDREATQPGVKGGALKGFVALDLAKMVGKNIDETEIAKWMKGDVHELPPDGTWILWRWTCEHCAEHLEKLALHPPDTPALVLVRLEETGDNEKNKKVFVLPTGPNVLQASLRDDVTYVITTPGELVLENGIIVAGREAADLEKK
ncbi:MAG: hypothetical protein HYR85_11735 [Planctomycetes bacterium]|nr:hypothetical protein [Planctomycetota bacterium]MBI3846056.1 hypothetical protein [Planctomycetota bacterium]